MKISLDDLIEHSFCIACNNADYKRFAEDFKKKLGVDKAPRMFRGFVFNVGFYPALGIWSDRLKDRKDFGCSLTHQQIIRLAKAMHWPYVCIFEDDARFIDGQQARFKKILSTIDDNTDVIRFMIHRSLRNSLFANLALKRHLAEEHDGIRNVSSWCTCAAAYIVFSNAYDVSLTITDRYDPLSDYAALAGGVPAWANKGAVLAVTPSLFDISGRCSYAKAHSIEYTSEDVKIIHGSLICTAADTHESGVPIVPTYSRWVTTDTILSRPNCCSIRTYAACLMTSFLSIVKWAEAFGHSSVKYITSRGTYVVEAKDYEKVQDLSDYNLHGVEDLKGVKKE